MGKILLANKLASEKADRIGQPMWKDMLTHFLRTQFVINLLDKCSVRFDPQCALIGTDADKHEFIIRAEYKYVVLFFLKEEGFEVVVSEDDPYVYHIHFNEHQCVKQNL